MDTPRILTDITRNSMASCRAVQARALDCRCYDAILAYLMYPNLLIPLHCFCPTSLISNTPFLRATFHIYSKSLRVCGAPLYYLCSAVGLLRARIMPAPLRCGMLCSRKHDYGQLFFFSLSDTAHGNYPYYSCVNRTPLTALPRLCCARELPICHMCEMKVCSAYPGLY
jgi:hypothetical protein